MGGKTAEKKKKKTRPKMGEKKGKGPDGGPPTIPNQSEEHQNNSNDLKKKGWGPFRMLGKTKGHKAS